MKTLILSTLSICLLTGCSGGVKAGYAFEAKWKYPNEQEQPQP